MAERGMIHPAYKIDGPAIISFSGGRTSGYMLWHILQAHGGRLPDDIKVVFCNTGKEREETLTFVAEVSRRWQVHVQWLEHVTRRGPIADRVQLVSHNSASRNGKPFARAIAERPYLPNMVTAFCSSELKVKTTAAYAQGRLGWEHWDSVIGLRADEPRRVAKVRARNAKGKERWETLTPLAEAGMTKRDLKPFYAAQGFDLKLPLINGVTFDGNCDLCFKKRPKTLVETIRKEPERADWWIAQEDAASLVASSPAGARFRKDMPDYRTLKRMALDQVDLADFMPDTPDLPCGCHD